MEWAGDSAGQLKLNWRNPDDFLTWFNQVVEESALLYGYRAKLEPLPKEEALVDRR